MQSSTPPDGAENSDENQENAKEVSSSEVPFTMKDLEDHVYNLVTHDPMGIKCTKGIYLALFDVAS